MSANSFLCLQAHANQVKRDVDKQKALYMPVLDSLHNTASVLLSLSLQHWTFFFDTCKAVKYFNRCLSCHSVAVSVQAVARLVLALFLPSKLVDCCSTYLAGPAVPV